MVNQIEATKRAQTDRIKSLNRTVELYILSDRNGNIVYRGDDEEKMFDAIKSGNEEEYTSYLFRKQKEVFLDIQRTNWRYIDYYDDMNGYWGKESQAVSLPGREYLEGLMEVMQTTYKEKC